MSVSPRLRSPPSSAAKTTVIVSNLPREAFLRNAGEQLSVADQIKLRVLNLRTDENEPDFYLQSIRYWLALPFLNRIIVIFTSPEAAANVRDYLLKNVEGVSKDFSILKARISLQENLLARSKSFDLLVREGDNSLAIVKDLSLFRNYHNSVAAGSPISPEYAEPAPHQFNAYEDLAKLGIDLDDYNSEQQLEELRSDPLSSPGRGMKRTPSLTKTLFRPDLRVDTEEGPDKLNLRAKDAPTSPTITLDESR